MERLLAQGQVACWVLLSDKESLLGIIVAHSHICVENLELCRRCIFSVADSYLTQLGPGAIRPNDHAAVHNCAVGEMRNHPSTVFKKVHIVEQLAILFLCG